MYKSFDMVILTRSSKYKKYCVAGLDLGTGALVRLVSGDEASHGALSQQDLELAGCRIVGPLDVVRVQNVKPCPGAIQKENHRIDRRSSLSYVGHMTIEEVLGKYPLPGARSVFRGYAPVMARQRADDIGHSLEIHCVEDLVVSRHMIDGKPRTRADFTMAGRAFKGFPVTDPRYYDDEGRRVIGSACVVFSIAEDEWALDRGRFKFVAAIHPLAGTAAEGEKAPGPEDGVPQEKPAGRTADRRRVIQHAKGYLEQLSKGIDPISGAEVGSDSVAGEPRLQKCFAFVAEILGELLANGGRVDLSGGAAAKAEAPPPAPPPQYELVRKKEPFRLSAEQKRFVEITREPVTPTVFINHINRAVDTAAMEKLSIRRVNAWLLKNGYIAETRQPTVVTRTVMKPMEKAVEIGIQEQEQTDPRTGEIKPRIVLTSRAQAFLLDNLENILDQ